MASYIDKKYVKVQGWMATKLGLHGNELIVYAYIYSFQFKDFMGKDVPNKATPTEIPIRDFMEWTGLTKRGVIYIIQSLQDKGLIVSKTKPGTSSTYSIVPEPVVKALKKEEGGGEMDCTGEKIAPVKKLHQGGEVHCTTGGEMDCTGVVKKEAQSGEIIAPHLQHNYKDNKNTTSTTPRMCAREAFPSLSTDTAPETAETAPQATASGSDMISTMTEEEKAQVAALEAMKDGIRHGIRPKWMRSDPVKQFPEAYSFLHKDRPRLSKMEQELVRKYSAWLICGKAGKPGKNDDDDEDEPTKEQVCTLPPPSEIGQEAYNAQKGLLQLVYGKDVAIHTAGEK